MDGCMYYWKMVKVSFSRNPEIPTTRRASKVCTTLITARSNEELALYDTALSNVASLSFI